MGVVISSLGVLPKAMPPFGNDASRWYLMTAIAGIGMKTRQLQNKVRQATPKVMSQLAVQARLADMGSEAGSGATPEELARSLREVAFGDYNPIWAISSMVATSDPQMKQSVATFRGRLINTLVGCAIGMLFLGVGHTAWQLPAALALSVLVSSYVVRVQAMWRQAPITATIVIAGSLQHHDKLGALEQGAMRVGEVLFGCLVGIACAWLMSRLWPLPEATAGGKAMRASFPMQPFRPATAASAGTRTADERRRSDSRGVTRFR